MTLWKTRAVDFRCACESVVCCTSSWPGVFQGCVDWPSEDAGDRCQMSLVVSTLFLRYGVKRVGGTYYPGIET